MIFDQLTFIRNGTLKVFEVTDEKHLTVTPKGFNNHILWNLGHIYVIQERMVFPAMSEAPQLNDTYLQLFNKNTSPANWTTTLPEINELKQLLRNQTGRIKASFQDRLDEKLVEPFTLFKVLTFQTLRDVLTFTIFHEGMHLETMKIYYRMLNADHK